MIAASTVEISAWVALPMAVLGMVATVAAAFAVWRQVAIKASLLMIVEANAELRKANDDLRLQLDTERQARATLEGKLEVFTSHFAQQIIDVVTRLMTHRTYTTTTEVSP